MIQRLKRKFILINMLLVMTVLLTVFTLIMLSSLNRMKAQSSAALSVAGLLSREDEPPQFSLHFFQDGGRRREEHNNYFASFCVKLGDDGEITDIIANNIGVDGDVAAEAVSAAMAGGREEGYLYRQELRYRKISDDRGLRIAFVDVSQDFSSMRNILLTLLIVGALGLGAFLLISIFLAGWALRPVERAWDQQRQFVADASHELKTPLTVILANTDILMAHQEESIACHKKWLQSTRDEGMRMKSLVEDMLMLARSDVDKHAPVREPVNLSDLMWNCQLSFETLAFEHGVTIEGQAEPDVTVSGDPAALKQLFALLTDNAVKYAAPNSVINMRLSRVQEHACFSVRNRGETISPEDLPHIFERFYRADPSRSAQGGFGLGLAIAQSIVKSHAGSIRAESSERDGTTFTVVL